MSSFQKITNSQLGQRNVHIDTHDFQRYVQAFIVPVFKACCLKTLSMTDIQRWEYEYNTMNSDDDLLLPS